MIVIFEHSEKYKAEVVAAKLAGFAVHFFDASMLVAKHRDSARIALEHVSVYTHKVSAILRCRTLNYSTYSKLHTMLLNNKNIEVVDDLGGYMRGATIYNYNVLSSLLPPTLLLPASIADATKDENVERIVRSFAPNSKLMLKDYLGSAKYLRPKPYDIENSSKPASIRRGLEAFRGQKGILTGGIIVSEFVELNKLVPFTLPFSKSQGIYEEYRLFFFHGELLHVGNYFEELPDHMHMLSSKEVELITALAQRIERISFFTIDVARKKDGKLIVIETNPACACGLPVRYARDFYQNLKKVIENV